MSGIDNPMALLTSTEEEISKENYSFLQQYVYKSSGIVLDDSKQYLIEARLLPIVRVEKLRTINDLCTILRTTCPGTLARDVLDAMTTNETLFFRDAVPFKALRQTILPALIAERSASRRLSFWSAAASSGQEAHTLAMMLLEMGLADWKIDLLGTDISEKMVARARAGRYLQIEVNRGLPAQQLVKYFTRDGQEWQIKDEVRRMVSFERFDLRRSMRSFGPFDIVLCRNVLIYFDVPTKQQILNEIAGTLHTRGYLLLGAAETTMNITEAFDRCSIDGASFYQKH